MSTFCTAQFKQCSAALRVISSSWRGMF